MKKISTFLTGMTLFAPMLAFAQNNTNTSYITNFLNDLQRILNSIIPVLITLGIIFFIWELVMFIKAKSSGKAEEMKQARVGLTWALVAIFIMFSFMGVVRILQGLTGTTGGNVVQNRDIIQIDI